MEASVAPRVRRRPITVVGRRLTEILAERGWSLSKLADASGISVSQLSLLTRGMISHPRSDTLQAICGALGIAESVLLGTQRHFADLRAADGVRSVPFVHVDPDGGLEATGYQFPVAVAQLDGRRRVYAAEVEGGGMAPHILTGDRVLFDPDARIEPEQMVLLSYHKTTRVAWVIDRDLVREYWVGGEGVWLDRERVRVLGAILYIMRAPPAFRAP